MITYPFARVSRITRAIRSSSVCKSFKVIINLFKKTHLLLINSLFHFFINSCACLTNNFTATVPSSTRDPCSLYPCGPNAQCNGNECECLPGYSGNPNEGCRPECILNSECPRDKYCLRNKCTDPCPSVCGLNAQCTVVNHIPVCNCIAGYEGDPFAGCTFETTTRESIIFLII